MEIRFESLGCPTICKAKRTRKPFFIHVFLFLIPFITPDSIRSLIERNSRSTSRMASNAGNEHHRTGDHDRQNIPGFSQTIKPLHKQVTRNKDGQADKPGICENAHCPLQMPMSSNPDAKPYYYGSADRPRQRTGDCHAESSPLPDCEPVQGSERINCTPCQIKINPKRRLRLQTGHARRQRQSKRLASGSILERPEPPVATSQPKTNGKTGRQASTWRSDNGTHTALSNRSAT